MMIKRSILILAVAALPASGRAAEGAAAPYLRDVQSPRAAAMGGAFVAEPGDAGSLFLNPAGLGAARRTGVMAAHTPLSEEARLQSGGFLLAAPRLRGAVGVGVTMLSVGDVERRDAQGALTGRDRAGARVVSGVYGASFGVLSAGVRFKNIREDLAGARGSSNALDAGFQSAIGDATWGAALENVGKSLATGEAASPLPRTVRWGASFTPAREALSAWGSLRLAADAEKRNAVPLRWRAGAEFATLHALSLRAGYDKAPGRAAAVSAGVGIVTTLPGVGEGADRGRLRLDYAHVLTNGPAVGHRLGVAVEF